MTPLAAPAPAVPTVTAAAGAGAHPQLAAALRAEVRAVLASPAARPGWQALASGGPWGEGDPRPLYRLLGAHRLLAPAWPAAFGGRSLPASLAAVVVDEMVAAGIPDTPHTLSVQICGNFLLAAGSPAQRACVLPQLAAGRQMCAVLYTEPEAGSDLGGLATRAVPVAGGWRITGRKVYSVRTALADLSIVAARTSDEVSQYQGLTLFLVPMTDVSVRKLPSLADEAFADVRLDGVAAGPDQVIGPVGGAWPLITEALALERTGADHVAKAQAWLTLIARAATGPQDQWVHDAGRLSARTSAARALSQRCLSAQDRGHVPPVLAAAAKLWCSETAREVAEWGQQVLGEAALWQAGDAAAVAGGRLEAACREAPGLVISAGTSEMMREVVGAGLAAGELPGGEDQVLDDLRSAVRAVAWAGESDDQSWAQLAELGLLRLGVTVASGGLGLGPDADAAACLELGACGYDAGMLDTLTVVSALAVAVDECPAWAALPGLLAGERRAALLWPEAPARPVADPGEGGLLLQVRGLRQVAEQPDRALALEVHACREPMVARQARRTAAGEVVTLGLGSDARGERLGCDGTASRRVLAGDMLRRAAWLIGAGSACVSAALTRARSRTQFGQPLLGHQAIAHRLADLTVHGTALRSLLAVHMGAKHTSAVRAELAGPAGLLAEAGRFARQAARDSVQVHGASGMVRGSPAERGFRAVPLAIARCPAPALLDRIAAGPLLAASATRSANPAG
jgi:alkylation response protein AidB-like acyl-CoA dehydrogenase